MKDFSPELIKKAVIKNSLDNPFSLLFTLVFFFSFLGFFLFNYKLLLWLGFSGITLFCFSFLFNYFYRRPQIESDYIKMILKKSEDKIKEKLEELRVDLDFCLKFSKNDPLVHQAKKQFYMINSKFDSFKDILSKKFNPDEITYGRFYSTAEQTHGAVLDNLEKVVLSFKILKDIDLDYLESRYDDLKNKIDSEKALDYDFKEFKAIQERIDLRESKFREIDNILSKNEEAMTEMNKISLTLSDIKTNEGRSSRDLEHTLTELSNLANNARLYEINNYNGGLNDH